MIDAPVFPCYGTGQSVSPASAAGSAAVLKGNKQMILTNLGANVCYAKIGKQGAPAASASDYPVPGGAQLVVSRAMDDDTIYFISPLGTTLHYMNGEGA